MELIRDCTNEFGTFGILTLRRTEGPNLALYTIEREWLGNAPNISCIPTGIYTIKMGFYNRGGYPAYEIVSVPGRTNILIHIANTQKDVKGCIGLGERRGCLEGSWGVLSSTRAHRALLDALSDCDDRTLNISWKGV